jgi:hypothetical protein
MNRLASLYKLGMALRAYRRIKQAGANDDALARAQFLEGVLGKPFNSVSGRGSPMSAISKLLMELYGDPTMDVSSSPWMARNTSAYDNIVRGLDSMVRGKGGKTGEEILQEDLLRGLSGKGNVFYRAGQQFSPDSIKADPDSALADMKGRASAYAKKMAIDVIRSEKSRDKREEGFGAPGHEEDTSELVLTLDQVEALAVEDPNGAFGRGFHEWVNSIADKVLTPEMSGRVKGYIDLKMKGSNISDSAYAEQIGVIRESFARAKKVWSEAVEKSFNQAASSGRFPKFIEDAQNAVALANEFRRKAARKIMARNLTAAERDLRSKVIRLAHQNPSLRPHLLPLLKQADEQTLAEQMASEIMAGRPWGGKNYKPRAMDYDDPAPGPGSPPCQPDGEGGCYEHTDMYKGYGKTNSGANGSAARREYNRKYREMMGL